MSGMDQFLASYFGTGGSGGESAQTGTPTAEDAEKTAQVELFAKLAQDRGIDVSKLSDAQVDWLWEKTFSKEGQAAPAAAAKTTTTEAAKTAAATESKVLEDAKAEHAVKLAAAQRFAEAEEFGKIAAHSYVREIKNIAATGGLAKIAEFPPKKDEEKKDEKGESKKEEKKEEGKKELPAFMQHEKKGSFDFAAAELGLKTLVEAGHDEKVATARLNAVLTLGLQDSAKTAAISDFATALERRSLEFIEAAGYPVEWAQG